MTEDDRISYDESLFMILFKAKELEFTQEDMAKLTIGAYNVIDICEKYQSTIDVDSLRKKLRSVGINNLYSFKCYVEILLCLSFFNEYLTPCNYELICQDFDNMIDKLDKEWKNFKSLIARNCNGNVISDSQKDPKKHISGYMKRLVLKVLSLPSNYKYLNQINEKVKSFSTALAVNIDSVYTPTEEDRFLIKCGYYLRLSCSKDINLYYDVLERFQNSEDIIKDLKRDIEDYKDLAFSVQFRQYTTDLIKIIDENDRDYNKCLGTDLKDEINRIKLLVTELESYKNYLNDIIHLALPIDLPIESCIRNYHDYCDKLVQRKLILDVDIKLIKKIYR
jgi:hypothetical protein